MMENQHDLLCSNRTIVLRFDANPRWIQRLLGVAILLLVGLLFSGCGGGGGGGGVVPPNQNPPDEEDRGRPMEEEEEEEEPPPPPPPPSCLPPNIPTAAFGPIPCERYKQERNSIAQKHRDRPEFYDPDRSLSGGSPRPPKRPLWALSKIKAEYAWADLELKRGSGVEPGEGVTVGVIDTGIDQDHPSFDGKRITEDMREKFLDTAVDETGRRDDTGRFSHGTAVASVIVARPTPHFFPDFDFYGVAPGADLKMFAIPLGTAKPIYEPTTPSNLGSSDTYWSTVFGQVLNQKDIDILNLSFGVTGIIENYDANDLRNNFGQTIAALEQRGRTEKRFSSGLRAMLMVQTVNLELRIAWGERLMPFQSKSSLVLSRRLNPCADTLSPWWRLTRAATLPIFPTAVASPPSGVSQLQAKIYGGPSSDPSAERE